LPTFFLLEMTLVNSLEVRRLRATRAAPGRHARTGTWEIEHFDPVARDGVAAQPFPLRG
jgi:hypothetical protein